MERGWEISLKARHLSPKTIRSYLETLDTLSSFLSKRRRPRQIGAIRREDIESYMADQLAQWKPKTASVRYGALLQFFKWCVEEDEISASPMAHTKPPQVPKAETAVIRDAQLKKLLRACEGREFDQRRDTAILRVFLDTGCRLGEVTHLDVDDVDFAYGVLRVMGKGSKPRAAPFGHNTAQALDRYIRTRRFHSYAHSPALWLGQKGKLTDSGITQILRRRCDQAGIPKLHPHQFRHTAADAWLKAGGSEGDAMQLFGWSSRQMLGRYAASTAGERAVEAHRKLAPGDRV